MHTTSITLLQRVCHYDDQVAWNRFFSLYSPLLLSWSQKSGLSLDDAADLVQDVFVHLMRELPKFQYDASRGSFRGWLKTVTINKRLEKLRRRVLASGVGGEENPLDGILGDNNLEVFWETEYQQHLVRKAMEIMRDEFESKTWKACWELTVNEKSAREVASELGMSEAAVYVSKSRVLRRLRQELTGLLE